MGQSFPCTRVRYTDLEPALPVKDSIPSGSVRYYGFFISRSMKESGLDLVVKLRVLRGHFAGLFIAQDEKFPSAKRRVWQQERFCLCESKDCDYSWPECLNAAGGICPHCMIHDSNWTRTSHDLKLAGLARNTDYTQVQIKANGAIGSKKTLDHTNANFAIRIDLGSAEVKPGHYYLTIEALEAPKEEEEKGFKKQVGAVQLNKGQPPASSAPVNVHSLTAELNEQESAADKNTYVVWIEQRERKKAPQTGNEAAMEEIGQDLLDQGVDAAIAFREEKGGRLEI